MSKGVLTFLAFVAGGAAGSLVTWQIVKKKYELAAAEEIYAAKEYFTKRYTDAQSAGTGLDQDEKDEGVQRTVDISTDKGYVDYSAINAVLVEEEKPKKNTSRNNADIDIDAPYVIQPAEYGEMDGYEEISLIYYSGDGILADSDDEKLDGNEIEDSVGFECLSHFGEYEEDSVYVRNDKLKCDYEILLDQRKYSDVCNEIPD